MILVVASRADEDARRLAADRPGASVRLLTPRDLSRPGWRVHGRDAASVLIAGEGAIDSRSITGVICLLPRILAQELVHIEPQDRAYVADEMTAFLVFWLSCLTCRKLNAPTAGCLSGPLWSQERWLAAAVAAGLSVDPLRRSTRARADPGPRPGDKATVTVTVAGRRCLGPKGPTLQAQARALAAGAGVDLLGVRFVKSGDGYRVGSVDPFPDVSQPGAADAIWDFFPHAG
jgi:hypothetical protein